MKLRSLRILSICLLLVLGISALAGGWGLIADPSGSDIRIPLELLENTPFDDYRIPGIILLVLNGVLSLLFAALVIRKVKRYHLLVFIQGDILFLWLCTQLFMNKDFFYPLMHLPYFLLALALILLGALMGREEVRVHKSL